MKPFARSTIIASLTGIFLLGAVTGGVTALALAQKKVEKKIKMENLEDSIMGWATTKLDLTPEQIERIRPLVTLACDEYRSEQAKTMQRIVEIIRASNRRVAAELTPEQVEKLLSLEQAHEASLEKKFKIELPPRTNPESLPGTNESETFGK